MDYEAYEDMANRARERVLAGLGDMAKAVPSGDGDLERSFQTAVLASLLLEVAGAISVQVAQLHNIHERLENIELMIHK